MEPPQMLRLRGGAKIKKAMKGGSKVGGKGKGGKRVESDQERQVRTRCRHGIKHAPLTLRRHAARRTRAHCTHAHMLARAIARSCGWRSSG